MRVDMFDASWQQPDWTISSSRITERDRCSSAPRSVALGFSASSGRSRDIFRIARVQAEASRSKMRDLQEPADDHDVLEKVDHLILIGKIPVKEDCRCQSEHGQAERDLSRTKTERQQQTTTDLEGNGNRPAKRGQRQIDAAKRTLRSSSSLVG
jgi:hypothetical protein